MIFFVAARGGHKSLLQPLGTHGSFMIAPLFNKEATVSPSWFPMGPHEAPWAPEGPKKKKYFVRAGPGLGDPGPRGPLGLGNPGPWGPLGLRDPWALGTLGLGDPGPWGPLGLGDPVALGDSLAFVVLSRAGFNERVCCEFYEPLLSGP